MVGLHVIGSFIRIIELWKINVILFEFCSLKVDVQKVVYCW